MRGSPIFAEHRTASLPRPNNIHRLKIYRKFMGWTTVPKDLQVLDIGPPNYIATELGISHHTGATDLNWSWCRLDFDVITNFEVLNHITNVQFFLHNCRESLKMGGTMYLATPKLGLISWFHGDNFSEYKREKLERLFKYVGFDIIKYEVHNPWPFKFVFYGLRPPFRYLFNRFHLWELKKR